MMCQKIALKGKLQCTSRQSKQANKPKTERQRSSSVIKAVIIQHKEQDTRSNNGDNSQAPEGRRSGFKYRGRGAIRHR